MARTLSQDLRSRVIAAVDGGMSRNAAAERFGVAIATAVRWVHVWRAWFDAQPDLDPERLVFIDETGASTKMARLRGRAPRGDCCRAPVPHGH